jgi:hypothetical protein
MITLTKGQTQTIRFTGTEKCLLTNPYFLFVFTHRVTNEIVKFVVTNISTTQRVDSFSLAVNSQFANSENGFWKYEVYEQSSSSGTSTTGKNKVEEGYMVLLPATGFEPIKYNDQSNTFITYGK